MRALRVLVSLLAALGVTGPVAASDPQWGELPVQIRTALASKFTSESERQKFTQYCDSDPEVMRVLARALDGADSFDATAIAAVSITGYGYRLAKADEYTKARKAWDYALVFRPTHMPAWAGLAVLSYNEENCTEAVAWATKVLEYRPDPDDWLDRAVRQTEFSAEDREVINQRMKQILGATSAESELQLKGQMQEIISACRTRR